MDLAAAVDSLPTTADLERVMAMLGIPGDPLCITKDHSDIRQRADLLAHLSAGIVGYLGRAETLADLNVDERAELYWDADREVARPSRRSPDGVALLDLQLARLAWVQHTMVRGRGPHPDLTVDTVARIVGAIIELVRAWRDHGAQPDGGESRPGWRREPLDPMLADALLMVRDAADYLALVVRTQPPGHASADY
jgi:hypothetical protein